MKKKYIKNKNIEPEAMSVNGSSARALYKEMHPVNSARKSLKAELIFIDLSHFL